MIRSALLKMRERMMLPVLRRLVRWKPLASPAPGYTILLGCNASLAPMLLSNLAMIARQDLSRLHEIIIIFDKPKAALTEDVESLARQRHPDLPMRFLYYTRTQRRIALATRSPWVFAWLSWSMGIRDTVTAHAILHDFDAMLTDRTFLVRRYEAILERKAAYLGIQRYDWGHIPAELGYVQTFEMFFDVGFVRRRFEPVDIFNRVHMIKGRPVVMDTFLHAQSLEGSRELLEAVDSDLVHPGQMICQFQNLLMKKSYLPPGKNNLLLVPYFYFLGGIDHLIDELASSFEQSDGLTIPFFGKGMNLQRLEPAHVAKVVGQMERLEHVVAGHVRMPVRRYISAMQSIVGRLPKNVPLRPTVS